MKGLRKFQKFEAERFFADKDIRVLASEPWNEYEDSKIKSILGTKYKCVIATDNTNYGTEEKDLNAGEQLVIKVEKPVKEFKKFSQIQLINPSATIYGQFQNEISVKADDITIITNK